MLFSPAVAAVILAAAMVTAVLVLLLPVVILPVLLLRLGILPVFLRWRLLSFHLLFVLVFGGGGKAGGVLSLSESSLTAVLQW